MSKDAFKFLDFFFSNVVTNFTCRLLATETVLGITKPQFWAWLPVFIFALIAFIEIDSMKS